MINLFLDTNVVMDLLLKRQHFYMDAANIFALAAINKVALFASPMTYATASYLIGKNNPALIKPSLRSLRTISGVTSADQRIVDQALDADFNDYEDALQHFSALTKDIDYIITRNIKDFTNSQVEVFTPHDFLEKIQNKQ